MQDEGERETESVQHTLKKSVRGGTGYMKLEDKSTEHNNVSIITLSRRRYAMNFAQNDNDW